MCLTAEILRRLNEVDRKIFVAAIMGVDITEVCSPERLAQVAKILGLTAGSSIDLTDGWEFNRDDHKRQAWAKVREEAPVLLIGSPPCTALLPLQEIGRGRRDPKVMADELARGKAHIRFLPGSVRHADGRQATLCARAPRKIKGLGHARGEAVPDET